MLRTDLALEAREMYQETAGEITQLQGVKADTRELDGMTVTTVEILDQKGSEALGKPVGIYVTIDMPEFKENGKVFYESASATIKDELKKILPLEKGKTVLVAGLGNWNITPDALGPKVVEKLIVTRHLHELVPHAVGDTLGSVCAVAPGVLGITGIETSEMIKGVVDLVKPSAVIAIDALAARKMDRVSTTIQISNTGINPGSGVGNNRKQLSEETLGVPVIAVGVPMVVDAATLAYDAVSAASEKAGNDLEEEQKKMELIKDAISSNIGTLMVTPKDVDKIIEQMANIVSAGINITIHDIELEEISQYIG